MQFTITEIDVTNGTCGSFSRCAMARAIEREHNAEQVFMGVVIDVRIDGQKRLYKQSVELIRIMDEFDKTGKINNLPMTITLEPYVAAA